VPNTNRTQSELLFEEYLVSHGHRDWTHEAPIEGKRKKPDYRLEHDGSSLFFEVKEFESALPPIGFGAYDPYGPIREKINQAARQFKEYKEFPCSVVLASPKPTFVHLAYPWAVIGAMLGNLGVRFEVGVMPDENHPMERVFLRGGKMIDDKRQEPQNTTISAAIVLAQYPLRDKNVRMAITEREKELGRRATIDEQIEFYEAIPDGPEYRRVRVVVYENPYARIPLRRDLFCGPFDARWGIDGDFIRRVYVGQEIGKIEALLGED
jgi:hypothetical protein